MSTVRCEPARRHKCEMCGEVFECHLCTIASDHILHLRGKRLEMRNTPVFVCEECGAKHMPTVVTNSGRVSVHRYSEYDYLTGESKPCAYAAYKKFTERMAL